MVSNLIISLLLLITFKISNGLYIEFEDGDLQQLFHENMNSSFKHDKYLFKAYLENINKNDSFNMTHLFETCESMNVDELSPNFNDKISKRQVSKNFRSPQSFVPKTSKNARRINTAASVGLSVSKKIAAKFSGTNSQKRSKIILSNLKAPKAFCPFEKVGPCNPSNSFRSIDGSCNNLKNPWWGKAEIPYKRFFEKTYNDGLNEARVNSVSGKPLTNPRVISRLLCDENVDQEVFFTHILPIFGQFLAHDMTSVSVSTDSSGSVIDCPCDSKSVDCLSISIPSTDNLMKMSCMKFTRSSAAFPTFECTLGSREQLNLLSSFLDATQIYGSDLGKSMELRSLTGGQLKTSAGMNKKLTLLMQGPDASCRDTTVTFKCFTGGEGRTNENLGLSSLQTLFNREHNRIAQQLAAVNPLWNDERLYQEARRINIATLQHIIYNEYLPAVIGLNAAKKFGLLPLGLDAYFNGYDENTNPTLANEFSTAGFRFGHTLVRNKLSRFNSNNKAQGEVPLKDIIFRPVEAYNQNMGGIDSILIGLINDQPSKYDTHFANTLQNHLFEVTLNDGSSIAMDLAAANLNRGRDHGIATYNTIRQGCGLKTAQSFEDLADTINLSQIKLLAEIYDDVNDIDLYIGGLSENSLTGGVVGPSFACLLGKQFSELKKGDRYFYENGPSNTAFSLKQLNEIKKVTLAGIICANTDLEAIQPNVFLQPTVQLNNERINCDTIIDIDFTQWISE